MCHGRRRDEGVFIGYSIITLLAKERENRGDCQEKSISSEAPETTDTSSHRFFLSSSIRHFLKFALLFVKSDAFAICGTMVGKLHALTEYEYGC